MASERGIQVPSQNWQARAQMRRGLIQLYEYRYLQNLPAARQVLIIERDIPQQLQGITRYLEEDRQVHLVWDGSSRLYARPQTRANLAFLWRAAT